MFLPPTHALSPDDAIHAALIAQREGREEDGLVIAREARKRHPDEARLYQVEALLHRQLDALDQALPLFDRAAALAPADARIAHGRARTHLEAGLPSVELFRAAHRLAPADLDVLLGLGAARFADEGIPSALAGIERALERFPLWLPGHALWARLTFMGGDKDGFTASFERALAAAPGHEGLWRELVLTNLNADRYGSTLGILSRARHALGEQVFIQANEAVCHAELGESQRADELFRPLLAYRDDALQVRYVRHLLRCSRIAEAAAHAQAACERTQADLFWPYLSIAWRLLDDPRWQWLEGQDGLVGVYDLADQISSLPELATRLRGMHVARGEPLEQSVRSGTQTDGPLFARIEPEIRELRALVVRAVERHIRGLPEPDPSHPQLARPRRDRIRFAGAWSVRLTGQGYHANHVHPQGWFSSALYVALPEPHESGPEPAGWLSLGSPQAELGIPLAPTRLVEPKPGRLVLFPSTMWHGTAPIAGGERLTVAFDVARPRQAA